MCGDALCALVKRGVVLCFMLCYDVKWQISVEGSFS